MRSQHYPRVALRKVLVAIVAILAFLGTVVTVTLATTQPASAAVGDLLHTTTFSVPCSSGLGVGVTFDGTYLWYSCAETGGTDLYRADPLTGTVSYSATIDNGLGALAYDKNDNIIWAGPGCGTDLTSLWKIQLDGSHQVATSTAVTNPRTDNCLMDGVAYDGSDGTLYISPDVSTTITQVTQAGVVIRTVTWTGSGCYNSGLAIGGGGLFQGSDGCQHVWVVDKNTLAPLYDFSTAASGSRDEGLSCDSQTFAPKDVMWSKDAYNDTANAFEVQPNTCITGGGASTTLSESASPNPAGIGSPVTFTYNEQNTGSHPISGVTVTGSICGSATYKSGDTNSNGHLDPGETWIFSCTHTFGSAGTFTDNATAHGTDTVTDSALPPETASATVMVGHSCVPVVKHVSPLGNPKMEIVRVLIQGTCLSGATHVTFGNVAATSFTVGYAGNITASPPQQPAGKVDVTVTTPGGGTSAINPPGDQYTYYLPTITQVVLNHGSVAGGNTVLIQGSMFSGTPAPTVSFGTGNFSSSVVVLNDGNIRALVPPHSSGTIDVQVTAFTGSSLPTSMDHYTYK